MMINFWAQWCGPCREEAPYLAEVAQHNQSDLMIMGVNFHDPIRISRSSSPSRPAWRYPQLQDADAGFSALQVTAPPVTVFVESRRQHRRVASSRFTSTEQVKSLVQQNLGISL